MEMHLCSNNCVLASNNQKVIVLKHSVATKRLLALAPKHLMATRHLILFAPKCLVVVNV